jgi:hypothetical protein
MTKSSENPEEIQGSDWETQEQAKSRAIDKECSVEASEAACLCLSPAPSNWATWASYLTTLSLYFLIKNLFSPWSIKRKERAVWLTFPQLMES